MNPDKEKSLKAMRTFARDVDRERGGSTTHEESAQVVEKKPEQKKEKSSSTQKKDVPASPPKKQPKQEHIVAKKPAHHKKDEPKHIPAFHELQKAVKVERDDAPKKVTKKKRKGIEPSKAVGGGTIITDTKKEKRSFFGELYSSLERWIKDVKKSLKPKSKHTYAVAKTERRKGVVQKATSKTGTIFSADNETLKEKIKARQRAEKHKDDDEDLSWSPYTEPGFALLEGEEESTDPRVMSVTVAHKKHTVQKPTPVIKSTEKIPELQEPVEEPVDIPEPEVTTEPAPKPEPEPEVESTPVEQSEPELESIPEPELPVEDEQLEDEGLLEESEDVWDVEDISLRDTNTLALLVVGCLLAVGLIGFILYNFFDIGKPATETLTEEVSTLGIDLPERSIVLTDGSFNELLTKTNSAFITEQNGITTMFNYTNPNDQLVPASLLMGLLRTNQTDGFENTISDVVFIKTTEADRAFVLIGSEPTQSLGGMLNWEDTLLADIGPLLDAGDVAPSAGAFTDTRINELDVRALVIGDNTLLVYTIKANGTVIIANDITALVTLNQM